MDGTPKRSQRARQLRMGRLGTRREKGGTPLLGAIGMTGWEGGDRTPWRSLGRAKMGRLGSKGIGERGLLTGPWKRYVGTPYVDAETGW